MELAGGSVTREEDGMQATEMLMTYSEEEKIQNKINKKNAENKPRFTVVPMFIFTELGLSGNEALIFAHIYSYVGEEYYFSNEGLAKMFNITSRSICDIVQKLSKKGLIKLKYIREADGGLRRYVDISTHEENSRVYRKKFHTTIEEVSRPPTKKVRSNNKDFNNKELESIYTHSFQTKEKSQNQPLGGGSTKEAHPLKADVDLSPPPQVAAAPPSHAKAKHKHGEYGNVLLSDEQYSKLVSELGEPELKDWIREVDESVECNGYRYKNFYAVIKQWRRRALDKKNKKVIAKPQENLSNKNWDIPAKGDSACQSQTI